MSIDSGAAIGPHSRPGDAPPTDGRTAGTEFADIAAPDIPTADVQSTAVWARRIGTRSYRGHNSRGASVLMGPVEAEGVFTPGELLKVALAGCVGMSADHSLARRLGPEVPVTVRVSGINEPGQERYPALTEELLVDLSVLDDAERDRVLTIVQRAVDRNCTVGRTLARGASVELVVRDPS